MRLGQKLGAALAEAERLAARTLHLPGEKDPHPDESNEGQPRHQKRDKPGHVVLLRPGGNGDALAIEPLHQVGVIRSVGLKAAAVGERAVDFRPLDQDIAHPALIDLTEKLREGDVLGAGALTRVLKQREKGEQQKDDNHPQGEVAQVGIHPLS